MEPEILKYSIDDVMVLASFGLANGAEFAENLNNVKEFGILKTH